VYIYTCVFSIFISFSIHILITRSEKGQVQEHPANQIEPSWILTAYARTLDHFLLEFLYEIGKIKVTCIKCYFLKLIMDGWHVNWMTRGQLMELIPYSIWIEKFGRTNSQLSLVLLGRIKLCRPWTHLGRADFSTHEVVI
jgi:hypothetical protein